MLHISIIILSYLYILYTLVYVILMCNYATTFVIIQRKEQFWKNASDDQVLQKVFNIILKYDSSVCLNDKSLFIQKIQKLKEYNMEFKIQCYKEGVKKRLNEIISSL